MKRRRSNCIPRNTRKKTDSDNCYVKPLQDKEIKVSYDITLEKFENAALFLQFRLPSTLIRHENRVFRKRSSNRRNLKTRALCFSVEGKHFENVGALRKQ